MAPIEPGRHYQATERIFRDNRLIYAPGDFIPHEHAVRLGLVDDDGAVRTEPVVDEDEANAADKQGARTEARATRATEDREVKAESDRTAEAVKGGLSTQSIKPKE